MPAPKRANIEKAIRDLIIWDAGGRLARCSWGSVYNDTEALEFPGVRACGPIYCGGFSSPSNHPGASDVNGSMLT
jgi:hypothetical protein